MGSCSLWLRKIRKFSEVLKIQVINIPFRHRRGNDRWTVASTNCFELLWTIWTACVRRMDQLLNKTMHTKNYKLCTSILWFSNISLILGSPLFCWFWLSLGRTEFTNESSELSRVKVDVPPKVVGKLTIVDDPPGTIPTSKRRSIKTGVVGMHRRGSFELTDFLQRLIQ